MKSSFLWSNFIFVASTLLSLSAAQRSLQENTNIDPTTSSLSDAPHTGCEGLEKDRQPTKIYKDETVLRGTGGTRVVESDISCANGFAGSYPCKDINLLSHISGTELHRAIPEPNDYFSLYDNVADIWGWTDNSSGREFAIVCLNRGTAYVEITDPSNPIYLGAMRLNFAKISSWCDVKVYEDHAYIVSESNQQGIQVLNLAEKLLDASP